MYVRVRGVACIDEASLRRLSCTLRSIFCASIYLPERANRSCVLIRSSTACNHM